MSRHVTRKEKEALMKTYPTRKLKGQTDEEIAREWGIHRNTLIIWKRAFGYTYSGWQNVNK